MLKQYQYANVMNILFVRNVFAILLLKLTKKRTVAVTQKAEIVCQRIIINIFPTLAYKSGNQQKQSAFRLMKIGDNALHQTEFVTWRNDNLCAEMEFVKIFFL